MDDNNGDEKLIWLLKAGDLDEVKKKVLTCEDANRDLGGRTPLHFAADFGNEDVLDFLINMGADINKPDKHGLTPLITACYEGHLACVKVLLLKGADKNLKGNNVTPYDAAEKEEIKSLLK